MGLTKLKLRVRRFNTKAVPEAVSARIGKISMIVAIKPTKTCIHLCPIIGSNHNSNALTQTPKGTNT